MTWDLVADIGGTNMRVAQVADGRMQSRQNFPMTPDRRIAATLRDVARDLGGVPGGIVAAGAGLVRNREILLTNGGWRVSEDEIAEETGAPMVRVINDFEAAAWSLANLQDDDVIPIGGSGPLREGHRAAVGPGTGLGVGVLAWDGSDYDVIPGEGGHVAIGPRSADEAPVFEAMCELWPSARIGDTWTFEAEALLSGTGLPFLYRACGGPKDTPGREVFARARSGEPQAVQATSIFRDQLAALAGNLAVTLKAAGGVFLLGGVAQSNRDLFGDAFFEAFAAGGRPDFCELRRSCGIYLVSLEDFGLRGCMNALARLPR